MSLEGSTRDPLMFANIAAIEARAAGFWLYAIAVVFAVIRKLRHRVYHRESSHQPKIGLVLLEIVHAKEEIRIAQLY